MSDASDFILLSFLELTEVGFALANFQMVVWIGFSSIESTYSYKWTDGSPLDFVNFYNDSSTTTSQLCGYLVSDPIDGLDTAAQSKWWSGDCNFTRRAFVCKKQL